jgi:hypothetical protein
MPSACTVTEGTKPAAGEKFPLYDAKAVAVIVQRAGLHHDISRSRRGIPASAGAAVLAQISRLKPRV